MIPMVVSPLRNLGRVCTGLCLFLRLGKGGAGGLGLVVPVWSLSFA